MRLDEIARELVAGCREGREEDNLDRLYSQDAVSVEAAAPSGVDRVTRGREGIHGKHAWWRETFIVHAQTVTGPFVHPDDRFAVIFEVDAEHKETGDRSQSHEVALYHVADGRIVREEFFQAI